MQSSSSPAHGEKETRAKDRSPPANDKLQRTLLQVVAGGVVAIVLIFYFTGAHVAAQALWHTLANSPSGSLTTPAGIKLLAKSIQTVAQGQSFQVVVILLILYLILQTFCIPGTIVLNAVFGALLGIPTALPLCVLAGTCGATMCYTLASVAGPQLADRVDRKLMKGKGVPKLKAQVQKFKAELFSYLLFLRLTPLLPNWLINLASPVVHVPLKHFALATLVGITPQTYLAVRFGTAVTAESAGAIVSKSDTVLIALLGLLVLFINRLKKKFGEKPPSPHASPTPPPPANAEDTTTVVDKDFYVSRRSGKKMAL